MYKKTKSKRDKSIRLRSRKVSKSQGMSKRKKGGENANKSIKWFVEDCIKYPENITLFFYNMVKVDDVYNTQNDTIKIIENDYPATIEQYKAKYKNNLKNGNVSTWHKDVRKTIDDLKKLSMSTVKQKFIGEMAERLLSLVHHYDYLRTFYAIFPVETVQSGIPEPEKGFHPINVRVESRTVPYTYLNYLSSTKESNKKSQPIRTKKQFRVTESSPDGPEAELGYVMNNIEDMLSMLHLHGSNEETIKAINENVQKTERVNRSTFDIPNINAASYYKDNNDKNTASK
jgi:hypothetical protein